MTHSITSGIGATQHLRRHLQRNPVQTTLHGPNSDMFSILELHLENSLKQQTCHLSAAVSMARWRGWKSRCVLRQQEQLRFQLCKLECGLKEIPPTPMGHFSLRGHTKTYIYTPHSSDKGMQTQKHEHAHRQRKMCTLIQKQRYTHVQNSYVHIYVAQTCSCKHIYTYCRNAAIFQAADTSGYLQDFLPALQH